MNEQVIHTYMYIFLTQGPDGEAKPSRGRSGKSSASSGPGGAPSSGKKASARAGKQLWELNALVQMQNEVQQVLEMAGSERDFRCLTVKAVNDCSKRLDVRLKPGNVAIAISTGEGDEESEARSEKATNIINDLRKKGEFMQVLVTIVKATWKPTEQD